MSLLLKKITTHRVTKFALVGVWNTGFDLALFNLFLFLTKGLSLGSKQIYLCNIASATIAALVSYELNQRFVFQTKSKVPPHYRAYFLIIVLSGIFILQSGVIFLVKHFGGFAVTNLVSLTHGIGFKFSTDFIRDNLAKVLATGVTMIWNYLLFKHFIFKEKPAA